MNIIKWILIIAVLLLPTFALAETFQLTWEPVDGAHGYKIMMSDDNGNTFKHELYDGFGTTASIDVGDRAGVLLLKVCAYKGDGTKICRDDSGFWVVPDAGIRGIQLR